MFVLGFFLSSGQDGGIGRNPLLPHTTKRRITTNLKSINNQKCQKIKLHRTPITKELKKWSTRATRTVRQAYGENWRQGSGPHGQGGLNRKLRLRADCGLRLGLPQWEKLPVSHEGSLESGARAKQASCIIPFLAPPPQTVPQCSKEGCLSWVNT